MDFESLGEALVNDTLEYSDLYVKAKVDDELKQTGKSDLEKAKGFLSIVDPKLNISLYDHLADVIKTVLRSKIPNAADKLEELSFQVKKLRQKADSDLTDVFEIGEELQKYLTEKQIFYKFKTLAGQPSETSKLSDEESDSEEDEENTAREMESKESATGDQEIDLEDTLPDLSYIMNRFSQAGIGLSAEEIFELTVALKDLAVQFKLHKVRFWGKVFGVKNDYYVAEAPFQEGITQEKYGVEELETVREETLTDQNDEEEEEKIEDEDKNIEDEETEEGEETEETDAVKIPPVPEPRQKVKKRIPSEANGTGVNEYLYFVCTKPGHPWRILPFMMPSHVSEARYLKRFFTGDLESQIRGCVPHPGKEAHYLRAQIARITASTYIAPNEYFKNAGEDDEDEEDANEDEGNGGKDNIVLNSEFVPKVTKHLYSERIDGWCHYRRAVLDQGRCIPMKLGEKEGDEEDNGENDEEDDNEKTEEDEQEEPEILEAIVEMEVPVLRSLKEDRGIGGLKPWSVKLSSKLVEEKAVLIMYSNIWPGAYTFYDGKTFDHIYVGYGFKYSVFHYAPSIRVAWQREYEGDDVIEHIDVPKDETEEEVVEGEKLEEDEDEEGKDEEDKDEENDD